MADPSKPDGLVPPAEWSVAERRLWSAFRDGDELDLRTGDDAQDDPLTGCAWDLERQVRAQVIATLLLHGPPARPGRVRALRVAGARVTGELNLAAATVDCEVSLSACSFASVLTIEHATTLVIYLRSCHLPELNAEAVHCPGLDMRDVVVEGNVWLQGSDITIDLNMDRARIFGWINGNLLTIGSWFNGRYGLSVGKWLSLSGARINGVDLRQADIGHAGVNGCALSARLLAAGTVWASGIRVAHGMDLRGMQSNGAVDLSGAVVHTVPLRDPAIRLDEAQIARLVIDMARADTASVSLRSTKVGTLVGHPDNGPILNVDALTYDRLDPLPPRSTHIRLAWLKECLGNAYLPQPYEQLAAAYRLLGHDTEARKILYAKHRHHRSTLPPATKVWDWLQDVVAGYGYRPARAGAWLIALTFIGTVVFSIDQPQRSEPGYGPAFNPTVYTLDLLLPIVDFGQKKSFTPSSSLQWFTYFLIALGWILATTFIAGLTRVLGRS